MTAQDLASSIYSGVGEFIPIPFIDTYFTDATQAKLVSNIFDRRQIKYDPTVPKILAEGGKRTWCGCCCKCVKSCCAWPFEKCFKSLFFWLTVRQAVLTACETYFLARFCHSKHLEQFIPETTTETTKGSLFRKGKTTTTVNEESDARTPTITPEQADEWAKLFRSAVGNLDSRLAWNAVRHLHKLMRSKIKKKTKNDSEFNNLTSTDIGQAIEKELPGMLAAFDAHMSKAFNVIVDDNKA